MGYSVAIVVDRQFSQLLELAQRVHVWVCASPHNRRLASAYWQTTSGSSLERGITTFDFSDSDTPAEMLVGVVGSVDLHHGEYSHSPPWETLEVYGTKATSAVRQALAEFGVTEFADTAEGFRCSRRVKGTA